MRWNTFEFRLPWNAWEPHINNTGINVLDCMFKGCRGFANWSLHLYHLYQCLVSYDLAWCILHHYNPDYFNAATVASRVPLSINLLQMQHRTCMTRGKGESLYNSTHFSYSGWKGASVAEGIIYCTSHYSAPMETKQFLKCHGLPCRNNLIGYFNAFENYDLNDNYTCGRIASW